MNCDKPDTVCSICGCTKHNFIVDEKPPVDWSLVDQLCFYNEKGYCGFGEHRCDRHAQYWNKEGLRVWLLRFDNSVLV